MAEHDPHAEVATYVLGMQAPDERAAFEQHLSGCASCQSELAELEPAVGLLRDAAPADVPPPSLQARTLLAIEREAAETAEPARERPHRRRRSWLPRLALAGAAAVAIAAAGLVGLRVGEERQAGTLEVDTRLTGQGLTASARVTETGIGRIVAIESEKLPVLDNKREFYEVWFVGPGDSEQSPNRVSAGTFHPDERGRASVRLAAAVVPKNYPVVSVTREPRNGDPRNTGPEVLRSS